MLSFNARLSFNLSCSLSLSLIQKKEKRRRKIRQEVGPSGMGRKNIEKILRGRDKRKKKTVKKDEGWDEKNKICHSSCQNLCVLHINTTA